MERDHAQNRAMKYEVAAKASSKWLNLLWSRLLNADHCMRSMNRMTSDICKPIATIISHTSDATDEHCVGITMLFSHSFRSHTTPETKQEEDDRCIRIEHSLCFIRDDDECDVHDLFHIRVMRCECAASIIDRSSRSSSQNSWSTSRSEHRTLRSHRIASHVRER